MGWMERLCETYDACMSMAGTMADDAVLIPVAHSTANAQIEVFLNENGQLVEDMCRLVEKNGKEVTIIPVTEDSSCRTNANMPHPLHDKLCYIAGDYADYTGELERIEYFNAYIKQLEEWSKSPFGSNYINAVLCYLKNKTLIKDLVTLNLLVLDEKGHLTDKANKIHGLGQTGAVVRFGFISSDGVIERAWEMKEMFASWESFYIPQVGFNDVCFVTGLTEKCASKHPNKIRNSGDKAKLISGNDKNGFTFRGRFLGKDEATTVGYVASQKAHNALRWLLQRQGYKKDGNAIVIWKIPSTDKEITKESFSVPDIFDFDDFAIVSEDIENMENAVDTGKGYAKALNMAMTGYKALTQPDEKVIIMAIDAATQGRMSITYYQEFGVFEYLDSIKKWYENAAWKRVVKDYKTDKYVSVVKAPTPREIALAAYGTDRGGYLDADAVHMKNATNRIISVILGLQKKIPKDIKDKVLNNVLRTSAYSHFVWEHKVLAIAYSILNYEGAFMETKNLNNPEDIRSILWGRLLAILDEIERRSMYIANQTGRNDDHMTNAKKYWGNFERTPMRVYNQIYKIIMQGYARRLKIESREYFDHEISNIIAQLQEIDGFNNGRLNEKYLVGYYEQQRSMRKKGKKDEEI